MQNVRSFESNSRDPVGKALGALRWFMEDPSRNVGVRELATLMDLSPSNAHRILGTLAKEDFLQRNERGQYELSLEFIRLVHLVNAGLPVREIALKHLRPLVDACVETAYFGMYDRARQEIFFGTKIESTQRLRYVVDTEHWVPVYAGASGLAVMAFLPEEERQAIVNRTRLSPVTVNTITEPYKLEATLADIRRAGYALTRGQRIVGAVGLAAPVFGPQGDVIGDVSLTVPEQRFDAANETALAALVIKCATDITRETGGRMPSAPGQVFAAAS